MVLKELMKSVRRLRTGKNARDNDADGRIIAQRLLELAKPVTTKMPAAADESGREYKREDA